jgi:processive 1,2-diacylglycerol beta-glucosyltransferase
MSHSQKILILSCSAGLGHVQAGKALFAYYQQHYPHYDVQHHNIADDSGTFFKTVISTNYDITITHFPRFFGFVFRGTDTQFGCRIASFLTRFLTQSTRHLIKRITNFKPDRIIATHFLIPYLLQKTTLDCPLDMVVTDYYTNLIWLGPGIRNLFVPDTTTRERLSALHQTSTMSGIPIHPSFYQNFAEPSSQTPTVLVLAGGNGHTNTVPIVKELLQNTGTYRVIAVAGKNNTLYTELKKLSSAHHSYTAFEFTDAMAALMSSASCIITKPGGLTITEALWLKKPLILTPPSPGQETYNADFITRHGYGILATDDHHVAELVRVTLNGSLRFARPPTLPIPQHIICE